MNNNLLFKVTVETSKRIVTTKDDRRVITPTKIFYFINSEMAAHFVTRLSHKVKSYNEIKKVSMDTVWKCNVEDQMKDWIRVNTGLAVAEWFVHYGLEYDGDKSSFSIFVDQLIYRYSRVIKLRQGWKNVSKRKWYTWFLQKRLPRSLYGSRCELFSEKSRAKVEELKAWATSLQK
jgi:hypothetical protein|tara:strand:+ start:3492 stop:4019 length:528 start_codon:yes stop_codon:yes gene_type:complete